MKLTDCTEQELLTACIWAEARGEPPEGQRAIGHVVLNRVKKGMADSITDCILAPHQFSWTRENNPNYAQVLDAVTLTRRGRYLPGWLKADTFAAALLGHPMLLIDPTHNADHYLNVELTKKLRGGTLPKWAQDGIDQGKVTVKIGHHTFLNLLG